MLPGYCDMTAISILTMTWQKNATRCTALRSGVLHGPPLTADALYTPRCIAATSDSCSFTADRYGDQSGFVAPLVFCIEPQKNTGLV